MKLGEIGGAFPALLKLSQYELPGGAMYKLDKMISRLQNDFEIYSKREYELLKKYGRESEFKEGRFSIIKGKEQEFYEKLAELKNIDIEIEAVNKIQIRITDEMQLSVNNKRALTEFIDFIYED